MTDTQFISQSAPGGRLGVAHTRAEIRQALAQGRPFLTWLATWHHVLDIIQDASSHPLRLSAAANRMEIAQVRDQDEIPAYFTLDFTQDTFVHVTCTVSEDSLVRQHSS
jgi:hypothetical protein